MGLTDPTPSPSILNCETRLWCHRTAEFVQNPHILYQKLRSEVVWYGE